MANLLMRFVFVLNNWQVAQFTQVSCNKRMGSQKQSYRSKERAASLSNIPNALPWCYEGESTGTVWLELPLMVCVSRAMLYRQMIAKAFWFHSRTSLRRRCRRCRLRPTVTLPLPGRHCRRWSAYHAYVRFWLCAVSTRVKKSQLASTGNSFKRKIFS